MRKIFLMTLSFSVIAFAGWREEYKKAEKEKNYVQACQILQKASDDKDYQAMWFLAIAYSVKGSCGEGVLDYKKAFSLYSELASKGFSLGYLGLSDMYKEGKGVEKNVNKSFDYLLESASGKDILIIGEQ